jgi:hypothetical protein
MKALAVDAKQITWEPFDPAALGFDVLAEWLRQFYAGHPWNEYMKCYTCSGPEDFTFKATWGRGQLLTTGGLRCPDCADDLRPFWTARRAEAFFEGLERKGRMTGLTVRSVGEFAGCLWGYEIGADTPTHWEPKPSGNGVYVDRILVLPRHRNGLVIWYLLAMTLREFGRSNDYLVTRTHLKANVVRTLLKRLNFAELNECPILPERSYWARSLEIAGGLPALHE